MAGQEDSGREIRKTAGTRRWFTIVAVGVVALAVLLGLLSSDSPWVARERKIDSATLDRLNGVANAIDAFDKLNSKLPASLADLYALPQTVPFGTLAVSDLAGIDYVGAAAGADYQLCASFQRASDAARYSYGRVWKHEAGKACFSLKAQEK